MKVASADGIKIKGTAVADEESAVDDTPRIRRDESVVSRGTQPLVPEQHREDDFPSLYELPRETIAEPEQADGENMTQVDQAVRHRDSEGNLSQETVVPSSRPRAQVIRTKMMSAGYAALSKEATGKRWADDLASLENASSGTPKRDQTRYSTIAARHLVPHGTEDRQEL